jgi:hypothetical protein
MQLQPTFEIVNVAKMGMKLGWNIKMNYLDEIHLDEKSRWNMWMKNNNFNLKYKI